MARHLNADVASHPLGRHSIEKHYLVLNFKTAVIEPGGSEVDHDAIAAPQRTTVIHSGMNDRVGQGFSPKEGHNIQARCS
jgi:hypothetical protein